MSYSGYFCREISCARSLVTCARSLILFLTTTKRDFILQETLKKGGCFTTRDLHNLQWTKTQKYFCMESVHIFFDHSFFPFLLQSRLREANLELLLSNSHHLQGTMYIKMVCEPLSVKLMHVKCYTSSQVRSRVVSWRRLDKCM